MNQKLDSFKPGVPKSYLIFFAGIMWMGVGLFLTSMAVKWLDFHRGSTTYFVFISIILALFIHHFGFLQIAAKNLKRIWKLQGLRCAFSFIEWKSYILIIIMISFGIILRHSAVPKEYLAIIYMSIGLALKFSSLRYFIFIVKNRKIILD